MHLCGHTQMCLRCGGWRTTFGSPFSSSTFRIVRFVQHALDPPSQLMNPQTQELWWIFGWKIGRYSYPAPRRKTFLRTRSHSHALDSEQSAVWWHWEPPRGKEDFFGFPSFGAFAFSFLGKGLGGDKMTECLRTGQENTFAVWWGTVWLTILMSLFPCCPTQSF